MSEHTEHDVKENGYGQRPKPGPCFGDLRSVGNGGDRSDICRHSPNNAASLDHIDLAGYC